MLKIIYDIKDFPDVLCNIFYFITFEMKITHYQNNLFGRGAYRFT
jgi:hypothetical protein